MDIHIIAEKGNRSYMEDTYFLKEAFGSNPDWIFGGIFDGHGGARVSMLAAEELPRIFLEKINAGQNAEEAFKSSFKEISGMENFSTVGCTALSFFIKGNMIWVANAGDGRMLKINKKSILQITRDHRLNNRAERRRVLAKGACIKGRYVTNGKIALMPTRSLGDHVLGEVGIISEPEVFKRRISSLGATFVAGTDGIWDKVSNKQVAGIARKTDTAKQAAEELLNSILKTNPRELDNITFMVIRIHPKKIPHRTY